MAQYFIIHPTHPQQRLIEQTAEVVRRGGLIVYPTDSCYALGCHIGDKEAMERMRAIRQVDARHHFTLVCRDLSEIGRYARVDNRAYRLLKTATPGSYTSSCTPLAKSRDGCRIHAARPSDCAFAHPVAQALLAELKEPLLSSTLILPDDAVPMNGPEDIRNRLEHQVDLVMDAGSCGIETTTVVDLTGEEPEVVRLGKGDPALFGVTA
jgi:tRNA threonylcarbamoyl adenosine modification protein (Sua5/YciO/YrdC/YwlC family)